DVEIQRVVEHLLAECLRRPAAAAGGEREAFGLLVETRTWHDEVDEPPRQRCRGVDRIAGERHLERGLASDAPGAPPHARVPQPRPPGGAKAASSAATARSALATSWQPAAVARPCTRATTGHGTRWIVRIRSVHTPSSFRIPSRSRSTMSAKSCPEQKTAPLA